MEAYIDRFKFRSQDLEIQGLIEPEGLGIVGSGVLVVLVEVLWSGCPVLGFRCLGSGTWVRMLLGSDGWFGAIGLGALGSGVLVEVFWSGCFDPGVLIRVF
ncbi:hypothetical protein ERY13_32115 [Paenibacillus mucilaginosus]|nr:hypothetical protein ERY13_32115 [Paenibacillus mucilaginosus]